MRYIELECARIVETLRFVRDEYRVYLEAQGCFPLVEMYWVVLRYGVKDWAVMLLRSAVITYIVESHISTDHWNALFKFEGPFNYLFRGSDSLTASSQFVQSDESLTETISALLPQDVFDEILIGGPLGRDSQSRFAHTFPGKDFLLGVEKLPDVIRKRLEIWDAGYPWTEGLARLFDTAQEEIFYQYIAPLLPSRPQRYP